MKTFLLICAVVLFRTSAFTQTVPELVFQNPVLESGTAGQDGAVYRFSNVSANPALDALVKVVGRSSVDVVLNNIDVSGLGFEKAFQPELGIPGSAPANTSWWMKFQIQFVKTGTNTLKSIDKFRATAIDIDGDAQTLGENVNMYSATSAEYSVGTSLVQPPLQPAICSHHPLLPSLPIVCLHCLGTGYTNGGPGPNGQHTCNHCDGTGLVFLLCGDAWTGGDFTAQGPVTNAVNIDTTAVQNMVTYTYDHKNTISFTYGATNGASATSAGVRMNSMWFKEFDLTPLSTLPVTLTSFSALLNTDNKVDLKWTTSSEINVSHFAIERSTNGKDFSDVGMVFAYGNTSQNSSYSFSDNTINSSQDGILYYRLRSVDIDGKKKYSEVRIIRLNKNAAKTISIQTYPNPVSNELRITIPAGWQSRKVVYEIINNNGQVAAKTQSGSSGQTETMNISKLSPGFYIVRVSCDGEKAQQKIVKH